LSIAENESKYFEKNVVNRKRKYKHSVKLSCRYLQLFVFELQQNKKIAIWDIGIQKIDWISNVVKIWTLDAHKNLIWLDNNLTI